MGWAALTNDERARTLQRARKLNLSEANLSSQDDLVVGIGGVTLDMRQAGNLTAAKVKVQSVDELVRFYGHPEAGHSTRLAGVKMNERRLLLRTLGEIRSPLPAARNLEGRTLNQIINGVMRNSINASELDSNTVKAIAGIAGRVIGGVWLLPNIVIEANSALTFQGSGPYTLIANKITIKPGGRIVSNQATVQISCNTLEVQ